MECVRWKHCREDEATEVRCVDERLCHFRLTEKLRNGSDW
jgi:hypothetical protein